MAISMQILGTIITCWQCLIMGMILAWPSSTLRLYESQSTPLDRTMTRAELALLGSISSIGAVVGTALMGPLINRIGRRCCCFLSGLLAVICWGMIAVSAKVQVVLTAVFLGGLCGAVYLVVSIYVCEFCQDHIRGAMTVGTSIFYNLGILVSYFLSGFLEYNSRVYVCLAVSAAGTILCLFLRESPVHLMVKGREDEAAKSLAFYRSVKPTSKEVLEELNLIRRTLTPSMDSPEIPEHEKLNPSLTPASASKPKLWEFIKRSHSTRKALYLSLFLVTSSVFQGLVVVQLYAEPLLAEAVPNMSATFCSVLLATITILTSVIAAYLTERVGRRFLMILSSFLCGICCLILGTQIHLHWASDWVTPASIYMFCISYTLGVGNVPYVFTAEVFLPEVKSLMSTLTMEWAWFCQFAILFIFNPLLKVIGLGPIFYLFAVVSSVTVLLSWWQLPETKGITVEEIQALLNKKRVKLVNN